MIMIIAAFLAGVAASMGLGGGMIFMLYLALFTQTPQITAQGMNLLFFLPIAALSLIIHTKNKLVEWKKILSSILTGVIGASAGSLLANQLSSPILRKSFAVFIILIGLKELFSKQEKDI